MARTELNGPLSHGYKEAIVRAHSLFADTDGLTEELDYYDAESLAQCGLEDFAELLHCMPGAGLSDYLRPLSLSG